MSVSPATAALPVCGGDDGVERQQRVVYVKNVTRKTFEENIINYTRLYSSSLGMCRES